MMHRRVLAAAAIAFLLCSGTYSENGLFWLQFLGPNRDGTTKDEGFVKSWLNNGLKEHWRISIGEGYSGVTVWGDHVYTMDSNGKDEFVVSLSAGNGKEVWRVRTGSSPRDVYGGYGPRVTPSIDRDALFTVSAEGTLFALEAGSGKTIWTRFLARDLNWRPPAEGTSSSPLVKDGRIYLMNGGAGGKAVAAFDRDTGKTLWTSQEDRASYSSAVRWDWNGVPQVLFLTGANLFSLEAASGRLLWKYPWATYDFVNAATPVVVPPDRVFISAGYDQGAAFLQVIQNKDGSMRTQEIWRNREMKNHFNNSVYHENAFYGFDNAVFKAIDAQTGQTLWREKGFGMGSVLLAGEYLLILSDSGELSCAKADRKQLNVERTIQVLKGKTWTPPSLAGNKIYLRNHSQAVCYQPAD